MLAKVVLGRDAREAVALLSFLWVTELPFLLSFALERLYPVLLPSLVLFLELCRVEPCEL